jgi:hypothetical protein
LSEQIKATEIYIADPKKEVVLIDLRPLDEKVTEIIKPKVPEKVIQIKED